MNKKIFKLFVALLAIVGLFASCSDDNDNQPQQPTMVDYSVSLVMPLNVDNPTIKDAVATFTNVQTKATYSLNQFKANGNNFSGTLQLPEGTYNIDVKGNISYTLNSHNLTSAVRSTRNNVVVSSTIENGRTIDMALNTYNASQGLVISEIYFSFSKTKEGKDYSDDQYIKIANNSDTVMYADGLVIMQTMFQTNEKQDYKPNVMNQGITIDDAFIIPGTGKDYPVQPGQEIVIAWNARNHKEFNENSVDLTNANFQLYPEMFVDINEDVTDTIKNNTRVPVLLHAYGDAEGRLTPNRSGVKAYALARLEGNVKDVVSEYQYNVTWVDVEFPEVPFDQDALLIPNNWVLDAVTLGIRDEFLWNVVSPSLDGGFAWWSETQGDANGYRTAVIRKKEGAKWVDTNNSTNDFYKGVPTLMN